MRTIIGLVVCAAALLAQGPRRAPGFALIDSKQKLHDLYDYRGKPVILEFMQSNCPHCAGFASVLAKVHQKYVDKIAILAIANPPDNANTVSKYIAGHKITYPILFDMGQVAYSYVLKPTFDLPHIVLIDSNGMIFNSIGYSVMSRDIFEGNGLFSEIDRLMAASGPAGAKKK